MLETPIEVSWPQWPAVCLAYILHGLPECGHQWNWGTGWLPVMEAGSWIIIVCQLRGAAPLNRLNIVASSLVNSSVCSEVFRSSTWIPGLFVYRQWFQTFKMVTTRWCTVFFLYRVWKLLASTISEEHRSLEKEMKDNTWELTTE